MPEKYVYINWLIAGWAVKGFLLLVALGVFHWTLKKIWPTNPKKSPAQVYADEIGWAKAGHWPTVDQLLELDRLQRQERGK